ncbi:MAG: cytochrome c oxidase subunit II [Planctomycetaceae bacterium]|nr:cytochrome c oxidase subunit II [Planctomycetaceae bacterium]
MFWPIAAVIVSWMAPDWNWWFPLGPAGDGSAMSPLGERIDDLFYMILVVTTITFIGTQAALGYVLFTGATRAEQPPAEEGGERAWFTHGSHNLEVMWTIVPAGILLFIALYQMDVWAEFRVKDRFPEQVRSGPLAEVTARQFEWRIRYPGLDEQGHPLPLMPDPQPTDLYTVNDLQLPSGRPVMISLRSEDVQHSFFLPELRVKQDAVPGLVIPVWFQAKKSSEYALLCAELCGWGHYKMKARLVAQSESEWLQWLRELTTKQNDDGVPDKGDVQAAN